MTAALSVPFGPARRTRVGIGRNSGKGRKRATKESKNMATAL